MDTEDRTDMDNEKNGAKRAYETARTKVSEKIASDPIMLRSSYKFDVALVRRSNPDDKLIDINANSIEKDIPLLKVVIAAAATAAGIFAVSRLYDLCFNVRYKKRFGSAKKRD